MDSNPFAHYKLILVSPVGTPSNPSMEIIPFVTQKPLVVTKPNDGSTKELNFKSLVVPSITLTLGVTPTCVLCWKQGNATNLCPTFLELNSLLNTPFGVTHSQRA